MKLCTLKVESNVRGQKIGELMLKAAFRHAADNRLTSIYVTTKPKQAELIHLLEEFGFEYLGQDTKQDGVFVKDHPLAPPPVELPPLEYHIKYAPHFAANKEVQKFLVPIRPEYHEQLFPDQSDRQLKILSRPLPGNAIKLAYLCNANTNEIKPGDILIFYRSQDFQECTTFGIVESADRLDDADIILEKVLKRTVYTRGEIENICKNGCLVLLFRLQGPLPKSVHLNELTSIGIKAPIQTIRKLSDEHFRAIAKLGCAEGCISAN